MRPDPARLEDHLRLRRLSRDDDRPSVSTAPSSRRSPERGSWRKLGLQFDPLGVVELAYVLLARRWGVRPHGSDPFLRAWRPPPCAGRGAPTSKTPTPIPIASANARESVRRIARRRSGLGLEDVRQRVHPAAPRSRHRHPAPRKTIAASSGTYTGAKNKIRKTGISGIKGAAWMVVTAASTGS